MPQARPIPILAAGFVSALTLSFGQTTDPELDSSTGTPIVYTGTGTTIEVQEPVPLEGYTRAPTYVPTLDAPADLPPGVSAAAKGISLRDSMTKALVDVWKEGEIWVRTKDFRSSFTEEGFTVYPIFGATSPQEWPVQFKLRTVQRGGTSYDLTPEQVPTHGAGTITHPRTDVREVYHLNVDSIEQTFVFDSVPGEGDLRLELAVETELAPEADGQSLQFVHPEFGGLTYGSAVVLDAAGRRQPISRIYRDGAIHFTVPSAFLAEATLPVTIDPLVNTFSNGFGNTSDDGFPDICYVSDPGRYYMCWQERTSVANADVYCTVFTPNGTQGTSWGVEMTNAIYLNPRIGHIPVSGSLMIVANRTDAGIGAIIARRSSTATNDTVGVAFAVSTSGSAKLQPCIGGTNYRASTNNHYIVAWSRLNSPSTQTVEYRILNWTGSYITNVTILDSPLGFRARQPAVSKSHGNTDLDIDLWTVAWIRDAENDGRGEVWARRIAWSGNLQGFGSFQVEDSAFCRDPTVTSRFDEPIPTTGDRPSIVAWTRRIGLIGGGTIDNIQARVIGTGVRYPLCEISDELEDYDKNLCKFSPSIGTDGSAFVLTYTEESIGNPNGTDFDIYMISGNIAGRDSSPRLALMERHQVVSDTNGSDVDPQLAMRRDGDSRFVTDEGVVAFSVKSGLGVDYGMTRLARVEAATTAGSPNRAVGVQYCDAVRNSIGLATDLRTASWLHIEGTQSVNQLHTLRCMDMPTNQFGLLIAATATGNSLFPGGSAGRLCLGGLFGRYNNQVSSSGPAGVFTASVDPSAIAQPNGPVAAAPGQTWYFQVWHRDLDAMGVPTSNFSNACALTFRP